MQSVCVYERENETESKSERQMEKAREKERECDFLSDPPKHLYSLATPVNYLVHVPFTISKYYYYAGLLVQSHSNFHYST